MPSASASFVDAAQARLRSGRRGGRDLVHLQCAVGPAQHAVGERPPTSTPMRYRSLGDGHDCRCLRSSSVASASSGQRHFLERTGDHHAVVAQRAFDRHVLVPDVVQHGLRVAQQRVAPAPPPPKSVDQPLAGFEQDSRTPPGRPPLPTTQWSGEPLCPPAIPGWVCLWLTTYWLTKVGVRTSLTNWLPQPPAPLAGTTRIGAVVTAPQDVWEQLLVDLGAGLDQVAVGRRQCTPPVGAAWRRSPSPR